MTYLRPLRLPGGRSWRRAGAALAAAVLAALALAIAGAGAAFAGPLASAASAATTPVCVPASVSDGTWMGDLAPCLQSHKLSNVVIPGSHDSLTYDFGAQYLGFATTQDQDITQQLNDGMRALDVRVGFSLGGNGGPGYYAQHGIITSGDLELPGVLTSIANWALAPGHEHEIIRLALSISQNGSTFPFPNGTCQAFGAALGPALLTPRELQGNFGTTDPGQVTLGQLWSLPDPKNAARVIMDNTQCLNAAVPAAGAWTPDSAYYADWGCDPTTVRNLLVGAAQRRATEGGGAPIAWGPAQPGGLYELDIQETPASPSSCGLNPQSMAPDQKQFLSALTNGWLDEASIRQNLNIILGDFVEDIPLLTDAIAMDERLGTGPGYEVAFQANTGSLWSVGSDDHDAWVPGLMPGTSPAITTLPGGGYEMAYQDATGSLWTVGTAGTTQWGLTAMKAGTSPAITAVPGGGYEVAFQANTGDLWTVGSGGGSDNHGDWGLGMKAGTSPSIGGLANGYEVAFQGPKGYLWTVGAAGDKNWGLPMKAGTSPAIAGLLDGGYEVAYQGPHGYLWSVGTDTNTGWYLGMMSNTSPSIAAIQW